MTKRKYWAIGLILFAACFIGIRMQDLHQGGWWFLISLFAVVAAFIHSFRYFRQIVDEQAKLDEARPRFLGIMNEVDAERRAQNSMWGQEFDDRNRDLDWMAYIIKYATGEGNLPQTAKQFRKQMIQTAALAVAAIEAIDRGACKIDLDKKITDGYGYVAFLGHEIGQGIRWPFDRYQFMTAVGRCSGICKNVLELYHEAHDFTPTHFDVPPVKGD